MDKDLLLGESVSGPGRTDYGVYSPLVGTVEGWTNRTATLLGWLLVIFDVSLSGGEGVRCVVVCQ